MDNLANVVVRDVRDHDGVKLGVLSNPTKAPRMGSSRLHQLAITYDNVREHKKPSEFRSGN